jgi:hypothetical protein
MRKRKYSPPPSSLRVFGRDYKVHLHLSESDVMHESSLGECHAYDRQIHLRSYLPLSEMQDTLLHEVLHALCWHTQLGLSHKKEERVVGTLASALIGVFRDNPDFLKYLAQDFNAT